MRKVYKLSKNNEDEIQTFEKTRGKDTERYREIQKDTEGYRGIQKDTERYKGIQRDKEGYEEDYLSCLQKKRVLFLNKEFGLLK